MNTFKLGFALGAAMLASVVAGNAQQVVKFGYAPFGAPVTSLPGATTDNYRTLDPKGAMAQGAMIDVMNAVAKDAGLQVQYVASAVGDRVADLNAHTIDIVSNGSPLPVTAVTPLVDYGLPIYNNGDAMTVLKSDTKQYTSWEELRGEVVGVKGTRPKTAPRKRAGSSRR